MKIHRSYLFKAIQYTRVNDISIFELFGLGIYKKVDHVKWFLGYTWHTCKGKCDNHA